MVLYLKPSSSHTMYSRSMKGSLMATISTFLEVKAARVTRRPMRPNLKSEQCSFLVWPLDGAMIPCQSDQSHWTMHHSQVSGSQWNAAPDPSDVETSHECVKLDFLTFSLTQAWHTPHYCCCFFPPLLCEMHISSGDLKPQLNKGQGLGGGAEGGVCFHTLLSGG